jgi:sporulation protein YlmC with PRC-barrel domain
METEETMADGTAMTGGDRTGLITTSDARFTTEESDEERTMRLDGYADFAEMRVMDLVGTNVFGANGDDVGEVDNVVLKNGRLAAIVGVGGFLGLGEHDVAVPLENFSRVDGGLMLDTRTEDELERMPEFNPNEAQRIDLNSRIADNM